MGSSSSNRGRLLGVQLANAHRSQRGQVAQQHDGIGPARKHFPVRPEFHPIKIQLAARNTSSSTASSRERLLCLADRLFLRRRPRSASSPRSAPPVAAASSGIPPSSPASSMARNTSTDCNSRLMTSAVAGISNDRKPSSRFSKRVSEADQVSQPKGTRASFDRMRRAKDRVQDFDVVRGRAKCEQTRFHRLHMFGALLQEGLAKLAEVDFHGDCVFTVDCAGLVVAIRRRLMTERPVADGYFLRRAVCETLHGSTLATVWSSFSGSNGLTIQPVAPAALPCSFFPASPSVVSIRMGLVFMAGCLRRF